MGLAKIHRLVVLLLGLLLAGCGGANGDGTPAPVERASPPAASPTTPPAASLGPVVWAAGVDPDTRAPATPVAAFALDAPGIHAVVPVRWVLAGTTLTATWRFNDRDIEGVGSSVTVTEDRSDTWVEFHLRQTGTQPWPDGTYTVLIAVNGESVQHASIEVRESPASPPSA